MAKRNKQARPQKAFVNDKNVAISLAKTVSEIAEEKTLTKIQIRRVRASSRLDANASEGPEQITHSRSSSSKGRLERAKAAVAAQASRAKREKAKQRKKARASLGQEGEAGPHTSDQDLPVVNIRNAQPGENSSGAERKRVRFG